MTPSLPLPPAAAELLPKISAREATVGVIGLGYVGLPLARELTAVGYKVVGFDIDPAKIERLLDGKSYIGHIPDTLIAELIDGGRFSPTADFDRLSEPDAVLICVPTPLDSHRVPDLAHVRATGEAIAARLRPGQLIVLESTTYPGTTVEVLRPLLDTSGLTCDVDYFLAYSPERENPGDPQFTTRRIPKVVGGVGPASSELASALYANVVDGVVRVSSTQAAEASKILENVYRCVNIALVNELKVTFERMGIDIWEVISASKTKPFGFQAFYPGPGLGGHCIPVDPFYLSWKALEYDAPTQFIRLAGEVNARMPDYVVDRVVGALNARGRALNGADILMIGVAYKADVDDTRESPALKLIELLRNGGAAVSYHDPHVAELGRFRDYEIDLRCEPLTAERLAACDVALIVTDHQAVDTQLILDHASLVVDTRGATRGLSGAAQVTLA